MTSLKCKGHLALHFCVIVLIFCPLLLQGQDQKPPAQDTTTNTYLLSDSIQVGKGKKVISIQTYAAKFNPRKALLYSAVLPGLGQIYNRKYWKLPIVYGGFIGGGYVIKYYQNLYTQYRGDLYVILDKKARDPSVVHLSPTRANEAQLRTAINKARRERDYYIILTGVWYVLQMVDAHVDAHLKEFDVNPQLKARLEPMMERDGLIGNNTGVALKLRF